MKSEPNVAIIDTGTCNLKSVQHACNFQNFKTSIISENQDIKNFDGLIVPGVGNFGYVMTKIREKKLDKFILKFLDINKPSLFICLGMQILFSSSEEKAGIKGLNFFEGKIKKFKFDKNSVNIPAIGWNNIKVRKKNIYFKNIEKNNFYFIHSYYCDPKNKDLVHSTTNYYGFEYCSSISKNKILACQFHPEKSSSEGLVIYKNFKDICNA